MARFKTWNEYVKNRKQSPDDEFVQLSKTPEEQNVQVTGEPLDLNYHEDDDYKKLLQFLRGKSNVPTPVQPPPEAPKGWFIADEHSRGFWCNNNWTQDTDLLKEAVIHDEKAAKALAQVVGGVVIPSTEVLG